MKEESRGFDVFFVCFLCLEERRKASNSSRQRAGSPGVSFFGLKGAWGLYSPGTIFEATTLVRPPPSKGLGQVDLDTPGKILTSCF